MQLVDALAMRLGDAAPRRVGPLEIGWIDDLRRPERSVGWVAGCRMGVQIFAEPESVQRAGTHTGNVKREIAARLGAHRDLAAFAAFERQRDLAPGRGPDAEVSSTFDELGADRKSARHDRPGCRFQALAHSRPGARGHALRAPERDRTAPPFGGAARRE